MDFTGGVVVLGLFGLLGALFAGVVADSVMRGSDGAGDTDDQHDDAGEDTVTAETQSIFAMFGLAENGAVSADAPAEADHGTADDGMPISDDLPEPVDSALTIFGDPRDENLNGNGGNDSISGAAGGDFLGGRGGDDVLDGGEGDDYLYGGAGADTLVGGAGSDAVHAEAGNDALDGGDGADTLFGHQGDDSLSGGVGNDSLLGGDGFDSLLGGAGDDALDGGFGRDLLAGGQGSDIVDGGEGSDTIWGQWPDGSDDETDFLNGGAGDDLLMLGAGDFGNGGTGADMFGLLDIGPNDPPMEITDFNPAEDALVVLFDANQHPDPKLTLETDQDSGAIRLLLDGVTLANLTNVAGISLDAITLRAA